ncbi:mucin-5AC [Drosophila erecta]|uniref:GG18299 n=1 Tax=Drosophila erecta TaxID=7220 RepID=B3P4I1_DROER|nr:mucin-5AC [Drosophila erecta]EDV49496.1 uncharacterized protein Dere_GG18299 [Drosophila erecta]
MERRRFNLSSMSPMADSTRIDASLISNRPTATSFLRGLSPKGSNISRNGSRTPERSLMNRTATSPSAISRQKLNLSQVDPRTFADVHSSGLASRIVAYHESSLGGRSGLQRSMSACNLYNPLTQPRRAPASPMPYRSRAPTLSITQIAPPERSFYSGNTLPSLLRSNSLAGVVQKASEQEQLSRENRPIMHPPHPQHESEPTRSVLEELKEISRKRINTGDTQQAHDFTKRSCQRSVDFVDNHRHQQQLHHLQQQQNQPFKRQRELTVSVPLRHHSTSVSASPPALQHMQSNGNTSPTQSPEQVAKRPNCSYSNDIASSLSSSWRHSNKRKLLDMREKFQHSKNDTLASGGSSPENSPENVAKIQRKVDAEIVGKALSMPSPAVAAVPASRSISAPPMQKTDQQSVVVPQVTEKPKLTLFNARQSETKTDQPRPDLSSPEVDAGEYAGIQFVKPKQQNSMLGVRNPSVERTHKTKLAIMLSGLKGELYQGEPDELDAPAPKSTSAPVTLPTPIKPIIAPVTTSTTTVTSTVTTLTSAPSKPVILSNQVIKPADVPNTNTTGSVPKLVLGQPAPPASTEQTPPKPTDKVPAAQADNPAKFELPGKPVSPATSSQPLISFNTPKSTAAPSFSFGSVTNTTSSTTTNITNNTTSKPIFSFGQAPVNGPTVGGLPGFKIDTSTTTLASSTNPGTPVTSTTTFGAAAPKTTSTVAPTTTAVLSFGQPNSTVLGTATSKSPTTTTMPSFGAANTAVKPMFLFGQSGNLSSGTPTTNGSDAAVAKPAVFNLGGSTTQAATAAPTPVFGSLSIPLGGGFMSPVAIKSEATKPGIFGNAVKPPANVAATTAAELPKPFGFPATTTTAGGGSSATNLFTFGGTTTSKATEPAEASKNNLFGQSATTSTAFAFGGAAANAGNGGSKDNKSMFAFGGGENNSVAKPSGVFGFGGTDKSAPPVFGSGTTSVTSATATSTNSAFGFSTAQKPETPMFGSGSTQQSSTPAVAATKPFTFGVGTAQGPAPSNSTASGGFSFAAVAARNSTEPTETNLFGSPANASKPSFNFGGNTATQAGAAGSPAGGFSFTKAAKKEDSAGTNMFGSPNIVVVKPNFSFSSNNPTTQSAAPAAAPSFGGFGTPAAAAPTAASTNQNKPFAFGGSTPASAATPLGGNLFANAVSATQNQPKPGVFSFGSTKSTASATAGNAPFSFGGASAGGIASPPSNQGLNTAKPFSFGGAGGTPAPNVFGSPAPAPPASNPAGGFSFGGASPAQQANAGNLFAPTPEGRPIRKATRRLQK